MALLRENELTDFLKRKAARAHGVLVYGGNEALTASVAQSVASALAKPEDVNRLPATALREDPARLDDLVRGQSFFGGRQVIVVDGCSDTQAKIFEPFVTSTGTGNFLLLVAGALAKSSALRKLTEEAERFFVLPVYEDSPSDIVERVQKLLHGHGLRFGEGAAELFSALCGTDRTLALSEAEKLSLYCLGQETIAEEDVLACCGDQASYESDTLIDAVLGGDLPRVDRVYGVLDEGEWRTLLPLFSSHLARLTALRLDVERLGNVESALRNARPPVFFGRKPAMARQLRNFESEDLLKLQDSLEQAVLQTRRMPDLAPQTVGRLLLSLAAEARRTAQRAGV